MNSIPRNSTPKPAHVHMMAGRLPGLFAVRQQVTPAAGTIPDCHCGIHACSADGFDVTGLTQVNVTAGKGVVRLLATADDACSTNDDDCVTAYTRGNRKVSVLTLLEDSAHVRP